MNICDPYKCLVVAYMVASFVLALIGESASLAGFVVAGALGLAFLKLELFEKFGGAGFSATLRQIQKDIEPIKAKESEPEETSDELIAKGQSLTTVQRNVLDAVANSQYSWRTASGVVETTGLNRDEAIRILRDLSQEGLVVQSGKGRKVMWGATQQGHLLSIL